MEFEIISINDSEKDKLMKKGIDIVKKKMETLEHDLIQSGQNNLIKCIIIDENKIIPSESKSSFEYFQNLHFIYLFLFSWYLTSWISWNWDLNIFRRTCAIFNRNSSTNTIIKYTLKDILKDEYKLTKTDYYDKSRILEKKNIINFYFVIGYLISRIGFIVSFIFNSSGRYRIIKWGILFFFFIFEIFINFKISKRVQFSSGRISSFFIVCYLYFLLFVAPLFMFELQ
jgi:hypothetical protein